MDLSKFFNAKSVIVVGVSGTPGKVGNVIFKNFVDGNFKGKYFGVNPKLKEVFGQKIYSSIKKVPGKIELGIIAVPSKQILTVVKQCGEKHIKSLVIVTSGFSEIGDVKLEKKLFNILNKYNIKVVGPNCLGIYDSYSNLNTLFLPQERLKRPGQGGISFVCQSGAAGSALLDMASTNGQGFSKFVSYGNAVNVNETDYIEYLGRDKKTKVICVYIEEVKSKKFLEVCKKVVKKKPVIMIKGGMSEAGSKAALSHTGSLAGSAKVYEGIMKQAKIIQVNNLREMFDYATLLENSVKPKNKKVQIITNGGGFGILSADAVSEQGLEMAVMQNGLRNNLIHQMHKLVIVKNPIDLIGDADDKRYDLAIDAAVHDKNVGIVFIVLLLQTPLLTEKVINVIVKHYKIKKKPIVTVSTGGEYTKKLQKLLRQNGVPTFEYPKEGIKAVKALCDYYLE